MVAQYPVKILNQPPYHFNTLFIYSVLSRIKSMVCFHTYVSGHTGQQNTSDNWRTSTDIFVKYNFYPSTWGVICALGINEAKWDN